MKGNKEVLGLWAADNEGAKFWLQILTDLQNRGAKDFFIACVDGLKGLSRSHRIGLSAHGGAVVYCAPGEGVAELRELETTQGGGRGPTADLPGRHGDRGGDAEG